MEGIGIRTIKFKAMFINQLLENQGKELSTILIEVGFLMV
jgi:hypothetical protein